LSERQNFVLSRNDAVGRKGIAKQILAETEE